MGNPLKPQARRDGLVINELPEEIVIYDLETNEAHCLNRTASLVWKHCDGRTTPAKIAASLEKELKAPINEDLVWYALDKLGKDRLLTQSIARPAAVATGVQLSRRELVKRLGLAAVVAVPLITTIVAPTAVEAAASGCVDCNGVLCCPPATCLGTCVKTT